MNYPKELSIVIVVLLVDLLLFLAIAPNLISAVPSDFWQFLTIFFALLVIYGAVATGLVGWVFRKGKKHKGFLASLLAKSLAKSEDPGMSEETSSDTV